MQRVHLRGVLQRLDLIRAAGVLRPELHELADEFVVDLLDPDLSILSGAADVLNQAAKRHPEDRTLLPPLTSSA